MSPGEVRRALLRLAERLDDMQAALTELPVELAEVIAESGRDAAAATGSEVQTEWRRSPTAL